MSGAHTGTETAPKKKKSVTMKQNVLSTLQATEEIAKKRAQIKMLFSHTLTTSLVKGTT